MQDKRKTATIVLITVLFSSLFVGSAIALREAPVDPLSRILQILLGIQPQISQLQNDLGKMNSTLNGVSNRLGNVEKNTINSTQMIFYVANFTNVEKMTSSTLRIFCDKPVLFTVSVELNNLKFMDSRNYDYMTLSTNAGHRFDMLSAQNGTYAYDTTTFPSKDMYMYVSSYVNVVNCNYIIMIQGAPGTSITTQTETGGVWIAY